MDKFVKKGLEFGAGMTAITLEAITNAVNKLEKDGKIDKKEGEKMVQDVISKYKAASKKYAADVQSQIDQSMKGNPIVTKKDIKNINARLDKEIKNLNSKISKMAKPSKKSKK